MLTQTAESGAPYDAGSVGRPTENPRPPPSPLGSHGSSLRRVRAHSVADTWMNPDLYVKDCAIHLTFQRGVTVHGTRRALIKDNILYDHMSHGYFVEDGDEHDNTFGSDLTMMTHKSFSMLDPDQNPANFRIRDPSNYFRHNHAAGSAGFEVGKNVKGNPLNSKQLKKYGDSFKDSLHQSTFRDEGLHRPMEAGGKTFESGFHYLLECHELGGKNYRCANANTILESSTSLTSEEKMNLATQRARCARDHLSGIRQLLLAGYRMITPLQMSF